MIASSVDYLDDAVELILTGHAPARLVVFDYRPEVDDQREALDAAKARLAEQAPRWSSRRWPTCSTAAARCPPRRAVVADDDDPLALLVYTSGSTGAPKGAMYPREQGRQHVAPVASRHWGDAGAQPVDHAELHADEPRDGPRHPLRHARQPAAPRISPPRATCRPSSRTWRWRGPPS